MIDILKKLFDRHVRASERYSRSQHSRKPGREMPRNDAYLKDGVTFGPNRIEWKD